MKKVLIDADTLAYRAVFSKGGDTLAGCSEKLEELVSNILVTMQYEYGNKFVYALYLTGDNNFRKDISPDYKAQRPKERPALLGFAKGYLEETYTTYVAEGEEADDAIAIVATANYPDAVIVSVDKDFRQVPCTLYNPVKQTWEEIDNWKGLSFFYEQMLVGDVADNIKGVYKVGPVKAKKMLSEATTERELWEIVLDAYEGDYDRAVMNGRLLWLRRHVNQVWQPPEG